MFLFRYPPSSYFESLKECLNALASKPDLCTPEILQDLSRLANLIEEGEEFDTRHLLEPIKCRLYKTLLNRLQFRGYQKIVCSNFIADESIELTEFLGESLGPLLPFFQDVEILSFDPLFIDSSDEQDGVALVAFIEQLKVLEKLKEVQVAFYTIQEYLEAVEMGLSLLSFVKLSIEIKSFSAGDDVVLIEALSKGLNISSLELPDDYFYSSKKPFDEMLQFFASLNHPEVWFSFVASK